MNIVTGCSGIDAIAYAALLLDIDVIGQIEIDDFCNKILELRFPGVKRYKDVFDVRGDEFGTVDIFAFGDPCQPHSVAGKRQGTADDRFIWPELLRIIQTMRPAYVLNENVAGSVSNGVVRDKIVQLESEGYRARAYTVPACAVGAPHERERVFIVGHTNSLLLNKVGEVQRGKNTVNTGNGSTMADHHSIGRYGQAAWESPPNEKRDNTPHQQKGTAEFYEAVTSGEVMADTAGELFDRSGNTRARRDGYPNSSSDVADTGGTGQQERNAARQPTGQGHDTRCGDASRTSRPTQSGLGRNTDGFPDWLHEPGGQENGSGIFAAFEAIFTATLEQILWPAGYGAEQYDYEPPRVAMGIKHRTNRLKALGNSIVWQQIFPFLLAIKLIEEGGRQVRE